MRHDQKASGVLDPSFESPSGHLDANKQLALATPTKRQKKNNPKHRAQGKCMSCKMLTSHVCRLCQHHQQDPIGKQYWICQKPGMACMGDHIIKVHPDIALDGCYVEEMETGVI